MEEDWMKVLWSDECSVEKSARQMTEWVYCTPADKWKPFAITSVHRSSRALVMVWAAFSGYTQLRLVFCQRDPDAARGVTGRSYQTMLERELPILMEQQGTSFMHDNAPIHTTHKVGDYLRETTYNVMSWPPYSPNLNPIEHCWRPLKLNAYRVAPQLSQMTNAEAAQDLFRDILSNAWNNIPQAHLDSLIKSLPQRVKAVIDAEGWYTKY